MKLFVIADMEGISDLVDHERQANPAGCLYEECRNILADEINAVAGAAEEQGVERVVVYDTHFYGLNLMPRRLHRIVWPILGKPINNQLDSSYAGLILLGLHSMAGTPGSLLPHTYNLDISAMSLNGMAVGEIGMEAALAAQLGVPVIMVSGDDKGVDEARQCLPRVETATTKYAVAGQSARCVPLAESIRSIHDTASKAITRLRDRDAFSELRFSKPFSLLVRLSKNMAASSETPPATCRIRDERTIEFTGDSLHEMWLDCRRMMKI